MAPPGEAALCLSLPRTSGVALPTRKARRVQRAQRIIRQAYNIRRGGSGVQPVRYELLGDTVALVVVRTDESGNVLVKLARELPSGRTKRLAEETREGFASVKDQIAYFDALYARYGRPD